MIESAQFLLPMYPFEYRSDEETGIKLFCSISVNRQKPEYFKPSRTSIQQKLPELQLRIIFVQIISLDMHS